MLFAAAYGILSLLALPYLVKGEPSIYRWRPSGLHALAEKRAEILPGKGCGVALLWNRLDEVQKQFNDENYSWLHKVGGMAPFCDTSEGQDDLLAPGAGSYADNDKPVAVVVLRNVDPTEPPSQTTVYRDVWIGSFEADGYEDVITALKDWWVVPEEGKTPPSIPEPYVRRSDNPVWYDTKLAFAEGKKLDPKVGFD